MFTGNITNNETNLRFEIAEGDNLAFLEYRYYEDSIALMHTLVPDTMSGKGIASALAAHAFDFAREKGKKVIVYCPYVAAYLKKHPELEILVKNKFRLKPE